MQRILDNVHSIEHNFQKCVVRRHKNCVLDESECTNETRERAIEPEGERAVELERERGPEKWQRERKRVEQGKWGRKGGDE